ncbi:MAG: 23S rRNA (guanosine(2251)-2'-O)-methyltransferase RlmB [Rhabdochlamydiaceae bacterium]|nr:23S rRNA (guanosine(2251)-2'-O)-methyltransferase RlmB [Candidatus Amphrikana amoebophyrae]
MKYRLIMGKNCITEVLRCSPERIVKVYSSHKGSDELINQLKSAKISIDAVSKDKLSKMVESDSHQSFVAEIKERHQPSVKDFLDNAPDKSIVLMLDSIYDPHNLGAILRAAECFGADLVIYSKNRGADITPVVSKTSCGASELVPVVKVSNLADTMSMFQKSDFWSVAADVGKGAQSLDQFSFPEKTLLIMGSEGKGVQPLLLKKCDAKVYIPMKGKIDSLNVSQATAVLLNSFNRQS